MPALSIERVNGDAAMKAAGIKIPESYVIFRDVSKGGVRVKYSFVSPTAEQTKTLKRSWAARNPGQRAEVYMGGPKYPCGYRGICLKVFNNK